MIKNPFSRLIIEGVTLSRSHARGAKGEGKQHCLVDGWIGNRCAPVSKLIVATVRGYKYIVGKKEKETERQGERGGVRRRLRDRERRKGSEGG